MNTVSSELAPYRRRTSPTALLLSCAAGISSLLMPADIPAIAQTLDEDIPVVHPAVRLLSETAIDQDDMCLWWNQDNPAESTVIASDKTAGRVFVYNLQGHPLDQHKMPKPGNIDIRSGFRLGGREVDLVVVNQREKSGLVAFAVNPQTRNLERVDDGTLRTGPNYGGCLSHNIHTGRFYFVMTSEDGMAEQYELTDDGSGRVAATRVRSWPIGKSEGAVADDEAGLLYIAEEERGIWQLGADPDDPTPGRLIVEVGKNGITGDLEGVAVFRAPNRHKYLVFSDQGRSRFCVYRIGNEVLPAGEFSVEGAVDTDGIELVTVNLGPDFSGGLFACHSDGAPCPILLTPAVQVFTALGIGDSTE